MVDGEPWWSAAACYGTPDEMWFKPDGKGRTGAQEALACCARCPVTQECLDDAMEVEARRGDWARVRYGVRGGLLPVERVRLAQQQ